jgi:hypothetical protein
MTTFFLDLWHDLREKRLWPVAAGLLAAVVAIPLVMLKPASEDTVTTPPVATPAKIPTLPAVQVDASDSHNSNLKTFSQRDPFKPLSVLKNADSNGNTASSSGSSSKGSTASSAGSSSSSSGGSSVSSPSSSSPSSSSTPLTSPTTPSSQGSTQSLKWFRYTADISFGKADALKTMKGVTDLTMLPNEQTAAIVFMGVTSDAKGALFFIADPAFTASGEGQCNDKQDCRFVKLTLDAKKNEETFTSLDGTTVYKLKLLKLNREFISNNQAQGDSTDSSSKTPTLGKDLGGKAISDANAAVLPRLLDLSGVVSQTIK